MPLVPSSPPAPAVVAHSAAHFSDVALVDADGNSAYGHVLSGRIAFDRTWSPYIRCSATITSDYDWLTRPEYDPRRRARLEVHQGYGNKEYTYGMGDLHVLSTDEDASAGTITIDAGSDETITQENRVVWLTDDYERTDAWDFLLGAVRDALAPEYVDTLDSDLVGLEGAAEVANYDRVSGVAYWDSISDVAARVDRRIWSAEDRTWKCYPIVDAPAATPDYTLKNGEDGTIISVRKSVSREDWYNAIVIRYEWDDANGDPQYMYGKATVTGGDFTVYAYGRKVLSLTRKGEITQSQAYAAAKRILRSIVQRGSGYTIDAVAAYWLRPDMTVAIDRGNGVEATHLVDAVEFDLVNGTMRVTTAEPFTGTITNNE